MSLAELVIASVKLEGRTKSEVARDFKISRYWVHQLVLRYEAEGEAGTPEEQASSEPEPGDAAGEETVEADTPAAATLRRVLTSVDGDSNSNDFIHSPLSSD